MARKEQLYGLGGYDPEHPSGNVLEEIEWDDDRLQVTYRRYTAAGDVAEERPATDADLARIGPPAGFDDTPNA